MRRLLVPAVVLAVCLFGADVADASTLSRDGNVIVYTDTSADVPNNVSIGRQDGTEGYFIVEEAYFPETGTPGITDAGSGCEDQGGDLYLCTNVSGFRIELGGDNDQVHGDAPFDFPVDVPLTVDLGPGNDFIFAGLDDDDLKGGPGNDGLGGSEGSDTLDGGFGADGLSGGPDGDVVTYASRTEAVTVDLTAPGFQPHGSSNDGPVGSRDHIDTVETIVGGSGDDVMKAGTDAMTFRGGDGADTLTGSPGTETLFGGNGADTIDALGGADTVLAGAGVDSVEARDGAPDIIDCGPGSDSANVDSIDEITSCGADPGPAGPPPPTIVTVTLPSRLLLDLSYTYVAGRRSTKLSNVTLDAERGARVTVACRTKRGKRCPRTKDLARTAVALRLKGFERRALPVGAKLTIRATKDGSIGVVKTLTMRKRKAPSLKTQCIPPGSATPGAC